MEKLGSKGELVSDKFCHEQPDIDFKTSFGFFMDEEELTAVIRFYGKVVIRDVKETV